MEIEKPHQPHNHVKDTAAVFFNYKVQISIFIKERNSDFSMIQ